MIYILYNFEINKILTFYVVVYKEIKYYTLCVYKIGDRMVTGYV